MLIEKQTAAEAAWSESERALKGAASDLAPVDSPLASWRGTRGAYGLNMLRHLEGPQGDRLQEVQKVGANHGRTATMPLAGRWGCQLARESGHRWRVWSRVGGKGGRGPMAMCCWWPAVTIHPRRHVGCH